MNTKSALRASLALLPLIMLASAAPGHGQSSALYTVDADNAVSESNLRGVIDAIFDDNSMGETRSLLVLHDGKIVAERYAPSFGPQTKQLSWSIAKSVTAVLVGLMVSDGRLALDSPAPMPAWNQAGDPRGAITLRQLLTMSSGLAHAEDAADAGRAIAQTDTARMLFTDGAGDMAAYAESKPMAQHPGTQFNYSSATSVILSDILTRMLTNSNDPETRRAAMMQFVEGRLKQPVGLPSLTPEFDARGTMIGGSIMHMTARDYAKFGEFLRNRGRANGRQILSQRWVKFMTTPSKQEPAYGGHLWLNRDSERSALFPEDGPHSLFACVGHNGQYILVSPRQHLTIVRLGVSDREQRKILKPALGKLVALFPN